MRTKPNIAVAVEMKPKARRIPHAPQFTSSVVGPAEVPDLEWGDKRRVSVYDAAIEKLLDAPKGSVLMFDTVKVRGPILTRARKRSLKVEFAEKDGALYVRVNGTWESSQERTGRRERAMLEQLKSGPKTSLKLAGELRLGGDATADAATVGALLTRVMKRDGTVIFDQTSSTWRLQQARAAAAGASVREFRNPPVALSKPAVADPLRDIKVVAR